MSHIKGPYVDQLHDVVFNLQKAVSIAESIGVDVADCKEKFHKAIKLNMETDDNTITDLVLLSEALVRITRLLMEKCTELLAGLIKEIEAKKGNIPKEVLEDYLAAEKAFKKNDFAIFILYMVQAKNDLLKISNVKNDRFDVYYSNGLTRCYSCTEKILVGTPVLKCTCGTTHHMSCAKYIKKCTCGRYFGFTD